MRRVQKNIVKILSFSLIFLTSCTTMADYNYKNINLALNENRFEDVHEELEYPQKKLYSGNDKSLKYLDLGLVSHYSKDFQKSNEELESAEKLFEKNSAKSISQEVSSTFLNDNVIDYSASLYEDIYLNIFMALNYISLQKFDDAMVEVRKFDTKLKSISSKMQVQIENQRRELKENSTSMPKGDFKFHNSALARYLSMILYRTDGDYSNAQVDLNLLKEAFSLQKNVYDFDYPKEVEDELNVKKSDAHLNIFAFTGKGPIKKEESVSLYCVNAFYKVATPTMESRDSDIYGVKVEITDENNQIVQTKNLALIENIENIAFESFNQESAAIIGKLLARMAVKISSAVAFDTLAKKNDNGIFSVLGLFSKVVSFASERADVRCSHFFPKKAYVSGINLTPGTYNVSIKYLSKRGGVLYSDEYENFSVQKGKLNFVEGICLR